MKKTSQVNEKVDSVVQEYMDTLLADLFPDPPQEQPKLEETLSEKPEAIVVVQEVSVQTEAASNVSSTVDVTQAVESESNLSNVVEEQVITKPDVSLVTEKIEPKTQNDLKTPDVQTASQSEVLQNTQLDKPENVAETDPVVEAKDQVSYKKPTEKRYPQAPDWAQQSFDVLLFNVCGLKLAVPMDTLGRIIKCEKELNALIGRPSWFMGAFTEVEESLYVVDTAKYIMPEKGFDLTRDGFDYLIQLQRSKWSLACQNVHTTVRLEPDQVKWRSQDGKRKWLAGTVIEHMCALVHVDSLVDILEAEAS